MTAAGGGNARSAGLVVDHLERAARHRKVGDALADAGDEWAAVCWFYGAYHLAKDGLTSSPVWDEPGALDAISPELHPDDRYTDRHKGRRAGPKGEREWGINELLLKLFAGEVSRMYVRLHEASIDVRYRTGLKAPLNQLQTSVERLFELHDTGVMRR